jgi:muramoyltetrapeptide carboxypeptidase
MEDGMDATRRMMMAGLGAALASPALRAAKPVLVTTAPRKPPRLRPGDAVGLISPASPLDDAYDVAFIEEAIVAMGLKPRRLPAPQVRFGYLAGTDRARADEVNAMFADDSIRALFAVRGGWGSARILPLLDWARIRANPKLVVGFSDITALHLAIAAKAGFITLHAPNAGSSWGRFSVEAFKAIAFEGATPIWRNPAAMEDRLVQRRGRTRTITPGKATGRLLGGNLAVLTSLVGTPYLPDFTGAILFIEEIDEAEYRIDRLLTQLGQAGVLGRLAGVVFGQCTNCRTAEGYSGFTLNDVLDQHLKPLGVPAYTGAMIGHVADQFTMPLGVMAEVDADAGTIRMLEAAVNL